MALSRLIDLYTYLSLGLSYKKTLSLQDWQIYYKASLSDFTTKNKRLGLALSRTQTIGVSVLIKSAGSKHRRKVCVS